MLSFPQKTKVVKKEGAKAVFQIEGLYPGFGVTIGNSLRRVLLSSLEGAAVTQAKIKGAPHEFSTLSGIMEDMVMILLSLKKLRFRLYTDEPQTVTLAVKGEKEVTGKDIKINSQMELINPEIHIATLTKSNAELEIEMKVEKGLGYELVEKREIPKTEVGVLQVDAIYTPVKKVSFSVDNMRVGKRTDFDLLSMEVETDGTMDPEQAMKEASEILYKHFSLISEGLIKEPEPQKPEIQAETSDKSEEAKKIKVEDMKISERTRNALLKAGIKTAGGLAKKSEESLYQVEGLGEKAITEIKKALKKIGMEIKE